MTTDIREIELLAEFLCTISGGSWEKKYTKQDYWRGKAMRLLEKKTDEFTELWNFIKGAIANAPG